MKNSTQNGTSHRSSTVFDTLKGSRLQGQVFTDLGCLCIAEQPGLLHPPAALVRVIAVPILALVPVLALVLVLVLVLVPAAP